MFWRDNRLSYWKALFSDSGQSIYIALSHFICKTTALRTAAQYITSKDLYKMPVKDFLFVSIHHNNSPFCNRIIFQVTYHLPTLGLRNILPPRSTSSTSHIWMGHWIIILNDVFKKTTCHGTENCTEGRFNWYVWKCALTFITLKVVT